jgi:transposase
MSEVAYYTKLKLSIDQRSLRYSMVRYAERNGIKPAARVFKTTPRTVRKWLTRWLRTGDIVLKESRSKRHNRKSKIPLEERKKAIILKSRHPRWGSVRIKQYYDLTISDKAIRKIWKEENLS